jgi:TldD protein
VIDSLDGLDGLAETLAARARGEGLRLIWRAQATTSRRVVVREGRLEGSSVTSTSGQGIQLITAEGYTALGSRDDLDEEPAVGLYDRVAGIAVRGGDLALQRAEPAGWEITRGREIPVPAEAFASIDLPHVGRRLLELERQLTRSVPGVSFTASFGATLDAWRVIREDGTDVLWAVPRCTLGVLATGGSAGSRHGVAASVFRSDPGLIDDEEAVEIWMARALRAARTALALVDAPPHPAGSFPLVIDYALAKGLAHEAFGHASEADGFRSSILAKDGTFRSGESVGAEHVSIVDEPVLHDHAWQPFSANGLSRRRATLVDHGVLRDALSDPWSADSAAGWMSGAARSESYRHAPQPRMTNIRIEVDNPLPAPGRFEDYGPEEVRGLLADAGVLRRHPQLVYLSGYSGGQVNTTTGDFVFQCKAIYTLGPNGIALHKPAIFSGSMFGALRSVREAFGPLKLDAIGMCGKWGQRVPSSGGSHYFLVLDEHPSVRLGGREA